MGRRLEIHQRQTSHRATLAPANTMPYDPLTEELIKRAQTNMQQKLGRNAPPQAGEASPTTMRAATAMRKAYPNDMRGVVVRDMPWLDQDAFSNILGETPTRLPEAITNIRPDLQGDTESIQMNPGLDLTGTQEDANSVMAHELQHVRQNRADDPMVHLKELHIPYDKRPVELDAQRAASAYVKTHPLTYQTLPHLSGLQEVLESLYKGNQ